MHVVSVNVGLPRPMVHDGEVVSTGIFKNAVDGPVAVGTGGLAGDGQADRRVHGGRDMAVYAYPFEHYAHWQNVLGRDAFPPGQFGENLTIQGLDESTVRIGDVLVVGSTRLQVTSPRIPCFKLQRRMAAGADFPKRFLASGRTGFYLRVLEAGEVAAGDRIALEESEPPAVTIAELLRIHRAKTRRPGEIRQILASAGLAADWRAQYEDIGSKMGL